MTTLTPLAGLVALAALLPALGLVAGGRRLARVRASLRLEHRFELDRLALAAAMLVVLLLALAAAQPAWTQTAKQRVRTDAQTLFVVDISGSMAAGSPPRLDRATRAAAALRAAIPQVPSGIATLTDRVLPDLLPVPDAASFDATLARSIAIEEPPPAQTDVRATSFDALDGIATLGYFDSSAKRRVVVLLTDGESAPYDPQHTRAVLAAHGIQVVAIRFWGAHERIPGDPVYQPDPAGRTLLRQLTDHSYEESQLSAATARLQADLGSGPTKTTGRAEAIHPLGPYVALVALLPLALVVRRRGLLVAATRP